MHYRRIIPKVESYWINPIDNAECRPFFGDIDAENDPSTFKRFFCNKRENVEDLTRFYSYIKNPDTNMFIIWGEVGIGKSFFIRNYLMIEDIPEINKEDYSVGIIDLLRGAAPDNINKIIKNINKKLDIILINYFHKFHDSLEDIAIEFFKNQAKMMLSKDATENRILLKAKEMTKFALNPSMEGFTEFLLDLLEYCGKNILYLAIDNIDRATEFEQDALVMLVRRYLNNKNIRLIIPLRKTSYLLGNQFKGIAQFNTSDMTLSPLILKEMIKKRFQYSKDGKDQFNYKIYDGDKSYTYENIFSLLFEETEINIKAPGKWLDHIAYPNARIFTSLVKHVIFSDHLRGIDNLKSYEYIISTLMLLEESKGDPYGTYIINLYENNEPGVYGNNLIRLRILEYFHSFIDSKLTDAEFHIYFKALGYDLEKDKIKDKFINIISDFVGANLLISEKLFEPDDIKSTPFDLLGKFAITNCGKLYIEELIKREWYYNCVKRIICFPKLYIFYNKIEEYEYISPDSLIAFFRENENKEKEHIDEYKKQHGEFIHHLVYPSTLASILIKKHNK